MQSISVNSMLHDTFVNSSNGLDVWTLYHPVSFVGFFTVHKCTREFEVHKCIHEFEVSKTLIVELSVK
jgi:hypothetical protein